MLSTFNRISSTSAVRLCHAHAYDPDILIADEPAGLYAANERGVKAVIWMGETKPDVQDALADMRQQHFDAIKTKILTCTSSRELQGSNLPTEVLQKIIPAALRAEIADKAALLEAIFSGGIPGNSRVMLLGEEGRSFTRQCHADLEPTVHVTLQGARGMEFFTGNMTHKQYDTLKKDEANWRKKARKFGLRTEHLPVGAVAAFQPQETELEKNSSALVRSFVHATALPTPTTCPPRVGMAIFSPLQRNKRRYP